MSGSSVDLPAMFALLTHVSEALGEAQTELRELKHGQAALLAELRVEIASLRGELAHYHAAAVARDEG